MPALKYCSATGEHKARVAALAIGDSIEAASFNVANSLRASARLIGLQVSVRLIPEKRPAHRVTILGYRAA